MKRILKNTIGLPHERSLTFHMILFIQSTETRELIYAVRRQDSGLPSEGEIATERERQGASRVLAMCCFLSWV